MHVLVPIAGVPLLALALSTATPFFASLLACLVIIVFGVLAADMFTRLSHRLRWIWLSLLSIYICFTPGEYMFPNWGWCPLTYEGLFGAALQILRLFAMLASVSYVLSHYRAMTIVSGIYQCLLLLGIQAAWLQNMVVRLYLILQQPLLQTEVNQRRWSSYMHTPEQLISHAEDHFTMQLQPLTWHDQCALMLMLLASIYLVGSV